jgi:hypothetical protein
MTDIFALRGQNIYTVAVGSPVEIPLTPPQGIRTVAVAPGASGSMLIEAYVANQWIPWDAGTVTTNTAATVTNVNVLRATATTSNGVVEVI